MPAEHADAEIANAEIANAEPANHEATTAEPTRRKPARRKSLLPLLLLLLAAGSVAAYLWLRPGPRELVLTGVVSGDDVKVGSQAGGQVSRMLVAEGDAVAKGQLLATLAPAELAADRTYYAHSADALAAQVSAAQADLAAAAAQEKEAAANVTDTRRTWERYRPLLAAGNVSQQQVDTARTAYEVAEARRESAGRKVAAARQALAAARQQRDAAAAQTERADVRLAYTEVRAPVAGIVDVRAVQLGEVVTAGQPIVTLIDPDSLWVRADVEETYIDRVRLGDTLTVRFPSGLERPGVVFYRGVDADFATQRDVSRTKRDIKTFEVRLRVDNRDRRLALGMTTYVLLPLTATATAAERNTASAAGVTTEAAAGAAS